MTLTRWQYFRLQGWRPTLVATEIVAFWVGAFLVIGSVLWFCVFAVTFAALIYSFIFWASR
jgi:hypothetical protein